MTHFDNIIGHEEIKEHLINSIENGRIAHAYILEGQDGSGKKLFAKCIAKALGCANSDVIYITHEKPRTITVDDIRTQLNADIMRRPFDSDYKVYIVADAEKMNEAAQNALLKTLEEPPEYGVILLLSTGTESFLPTITSRCVTLSLRNVPTDRIRDYLKETYSLSDEEASVCAAFSQGMVGKARMYAVSEEFAQAKEAVVALARRIREVDSYEMSQAVRRINEYNMEPSDFLDMLMAWFRDVLRFKATQDGNDMIFRDEIMEIKNQSNVASYAGLGDIIDAIDRAKLRLKANVSFDLTIGLLLETIRESMK